MKKRAFALLAADIAIALAVLGSYSAMTFFGLAKGSPLTETTIASAKYYTIDSNLLCGLAAALMIPADLALLKGKPVARWRAVLMLSGTASVGLTLIVVMTFLGPLYGYRSMLAGSNLYLHLLIPLAALAAFSFRPGLPLRPVHSLSAALPTMLYAAIYCGNLYLNGVGDRRQNDFYSFTVFIPRPYWWAMVFFFTLVVFLLSGLLRRLNRCFG